MPMAAQPTRRDRWLALGLLLAVIAVAYLLLVHPWLTRPLLAINADIAAVQERQQRVEAQLAQRGQIATQLRDVQTALDGRPGFLREATAESAAAALSSRLQDAVASASPGNRSCTISNRTPLPDASREPAFPRVALQVRLRCGVPEMAAVLHTLETGTPRLFVDNLNLLAQRFQQSPSETGTGLDVSFELVGYLRPGAALEPGATMPPPLPLPAGQDAGQNADPGEAAPIDAAEPAPAPDAAEEVEHEA
ncbi:type II secretion system protein GspM [Stenotrophomonas sp. SRS1]|uniref:type II secretion system protein GspM n=1 Tax=Stenotrophomonas sp. SRS1 TaxID=2870345 RepID=UPI002238C5D6|nr:type II secretion system protein GspM [Stenotrophomonas sp. SRS1]